MLAASVSIVAGAIAFGTLRVTASNPVDVSNQALQMDGNIAGPPSPPPYDWANLFTPNCAAPGTPNPTTCPPGAQPVSVGPFFGTDFKADWSLNADGTFNTRDTSTYATGSKDTLGIGNGGWQCSASNNVGNKVDITNFYVTAQLVNGHLIAYFGLEKFGSNGTNDIGVWFLADQGADCSSSSGAINWSGHHHDGDTLITSEFTSGGVTSSVEAFIWKCPGATTGLQCDNNGTLTTGPKVGSVVTGVYNGSQCNSANPGYVGLCAITNSSDLTNVPWLTASAAGVDHTVPTVQFYEGAADLTDIMGGNVCVGRAVADTRSSATPNATLFDFASQNFAACGGLAVHKYIDVNGDGSDSLPNTPDLNGSGWTFTVKDSGNNTICTGTTDANGNLVCSSGTLTNLPTGTYTVTETQQSGFYNTDPGNTASGATYPNINTGATGETPNPLTKTVTINPGQTASVDFGNDCFRSFSPTVNDITAPSGQSVVVDWSVNSGSYDAGATGSLTLTASGTTWSGTTNAVFTRGDTITWKYYLSGDTTDKVTANTGLSMGTAATNYPTCNQTDSATFGPPTVDGFKYKDNPPLGGDGTTAGTPGAEDTAIAGFTFQLWSGSSVATGTLVSSTTSDATGKFSFASLQPGTYTIHEVVPTGWKQTYPVDGSGNATDKTFTVTLTTASPIHDGNWLDTPLSHFTITVTPEGTLPGTGTPGTPATHAGTMTCTLTGESQTGNTYSSGNGLTEGTYTCTVPIIDP